MSGPLKHTNKEVRSQNRDEAVVEAFGEEWRHFDQRGMSPEERTRLFDGYFRVFPWSDLPRGAIGFDLGCGSGRWAALVAPRVGTLHCIDPSTQALEVARHNLSHLPNCFFYNAAVDAIPVEDASMDFGYSVGVLHHVPDTAAGIAACVRKLKVGAPFLVYLYYRFDNRPPWFRALWKTSDVARRVISRLPWAARLGVSQVLATTVYLPLARTARILEIAGIPVDSFPLSAYRMASFYHMRNDALDRFGTRLERRFTREDITRMMTSAGLERIAFSDKFPFWCAVGWRAKR